MTVAFLGWQLATILYIYIPRASEQPSSFSARRECLSHYRICRWYMQHWSWGKVCVCFHEQFGWSTLQDYCCGNAGDIALGCNCKPSRSYVFITSAYASIAVTCVVLITPSPKGHRVQVQPPSLQPCVAFPSVMTLLGCGLVILLAYNLPFACDMFANMLSC